MEVSVAVAVAVAVATGCVKPTDFGHCGDFTCGLGAVCSPDGRRCVAPETVEACVGLAEDDRCVYTGVSAAVCHAGICVPGGCGNGAVEPALGEVCDDGNFASGDGCRGDCKSAETCGDGIQDLVANEYCDCGTSGAPVAGAPCDGSANSDAPGAVCRSDCTLARCGDGIVDPGESCDDGNNVPGDGCRADCAGRWTVMDSGTYNDLRSVWGTGPNDVYAAGQYRVLHYDGSRWSVMPNDNGFDNLLWISGSSANDITVASYAKVYHYNGTSWANVTPSAFGDTRGGMTITGPADGWIAGTSSGGYDMYRWNGATWSVSSKPGGFAGATDVWGRAPNDVYLAAGYLWHFGGTAWTMVGGPADRVTAASATDAIALNGNNYSHLSGSTWTDGQCPDDIASATAIGGTAGDYVIVGDGGKVLQFDGTTCSLSPTNVTWDLKDVWGYAPGHAFIVGDGGTILY